MEVYCQLNKYKVTVGDDSLPAQDLISFELIDDWNLSEYLLDEGVVITRQLESDAVFNFAVSSVGLSFLQNDTLEAEFTRANLEEYTYEIKIWAGENGIINLSDPKFIGQIDSNNITYNQDEQTWDIKVRDWYKFFYDTLSTVAWNYLSGNLEYYLESTFGIGSNKFIKSYRVDTPYVPSNTDWSDADIDIENLKDNKLLSRTDFLFEVIKHYGAFLYIDSYYRLNFISRTRQALNLNGYPINDFILDKTTVRTFLRDSYYDAILISQKTIISPTLSEISWKLLRYANGILEVQSITDEDQISQLQKGLRILDLRQKLGAIASGTYPNVTYSWGYRMGYKLFPQRDYEDTLIDYHDLFRRPVLLETEIDTKLFYNQYGVNVGLLTHIVYDDGNEAVQYVVEYIEEDLVNEKMLIRAKEYFNPNILPE